MSDAILQKGYTLDFLTKKRVKNDGQMQSFYVEDSHDAIMAFVMGWNVLVSEKEKHKSRWKELQKDDNKLTRFRAGHFLKMFDDIGMVKEVKVDHILATLETIKVFEDGQLIIKFLEGSEVRLDGE